MHVHVSVYDKAGNNLLAANGQRALRHAVAGCLDVLPHCMPIFAPNHNAMRRLERHGERRLARQLGL
jgi:glutamine synthetase